MQRLSPFPPLPLCTTTFISCPSVNAHCRFLKLCMICSCMGYPKWRLRKLYCRVPLTKAASTRLAPPNRLPLTAVIFKLRSCSGCAPSVGRCERSGARPAAGDAKRARKGEGSCCIPGAGVLLSVSFPLLSTTPRVPGKWHQPCRKELQIDVGYTPKIDTECWSISAGQTAASLT